MKIRKQSVKKIFKPYSFSEQGAVANDGPLSYIEIKKTHSK